MIELKDEYLYNFDRAAKLIKGNNDFRIFSHYDADGVSSAIIIVEMLRRENKKFHLTFLKSFDPEVIRESKNKILLISDLGADGIKEFNSETTILVDHHTSPPPEDKKFIDLNPRSYGYDGSREACSSTVAFLTSLFINEKNEDLFPFFISGLIGDKQDVGGYYGINLEIVKNYGKNYFSKKDLNIDGDNVLDAIYYSTDPYFDGLSGERENSKEFLIKLGIDPASKIEDLSEDMKTKLTDALMINLLKGKTAKEGYDSLVTNKYFFDKLAMSDHLLSSYIDYSGRNDEMGLPVSWVLGNDDALDSMRNIWISFKEDVLSEIKNARNNIKKLNNIQYFHVNSPSLAGTAAGICMLYLFDKDKPTIALYSNKSIKVSSRATWELVNRGVDLSVAVSKAASEVGGHGGGHNIASGAEIPLDKENEFLNKLDKIVGDQIGNT